MTYGLRRLRPLLLCLALLLQACCTHPKVMPLDQKWRPLETLKQSDTQPLGVFWTVVPVVNTKDLCDFIDRSRVDQDGLLLHEQLHAIRQLATPRGPQQYLYFYATDPVFRLDEEKLGWGVQLTYVVQHGGTVDTDYVATFLSTHYVANDGKPLWSYDEALKWVNELLKKSKPE